MCAFRSSHFFAHLLAHIHYSQDQAQAQDPRPKTKTKSLYLKMPGGFAAGGMQGNRGGFVVRTPGIPTGVPNLTANVTYGQNIGAGSKDRQYGVGFTYKF